MKRSTAFLLVLAIVALIVANSADFFFRTPFYETWDTAANAFSVNRAKHFAQVYGPYSRWGFYHPGPALFYVQALGEWLFFDLLRLTPAPFNAQTLFYLFVSAGFFVAALRVFTRWLPAGRERWWFVGAAAGAGALHFCAVNLMPSYDPIAGPNVFTGLWSGHALVLPFLCLLTAGASVATGEGRDLPLLALADGFLLQTHVAQPLFVFPLTALALAGLAWRCDREGRAARRFMPPPPRWQSVGRALWSAWRAYRGPMVLAALILGFFALPVVIDLTRGSHSNLSAILNHLRHHRGERKTLIRSVCYFLVFGGYEPCTPGLNEFLKVNRAAMLSYVQARWALYVFWAGGLLVVLWALSGLARPPEAGDRDAAGIDPALLGERPGRQRFLGTAAAFLLAGIGLTLKWGTMQDGQMFYYNAWFNFGIYFFGVLIGLAVLCRWALRILRLPGELPPGRPEWLAGAGALAVVCLLAAGPWRVYDPDALSTLAFHDSVLRALAATAPPPGGPVPQRILRFPAGTWVTMAGAGLEMERRNLPFYVPDEHGMEFGQRHSWNADAARLAKSGALQPWHIEAFYSLRKRLTQTGGKPGDYVHIVTPGMNTLGTGWVDVLYLRLTMPRMDPAAPGGARIDFRTGGNAEEYFLGGWSGAEPWGAWTNSHAASLAFRAVPVPAGTDTVDLTFADVRPFVVPAQGLQRQRVRMFFNGEPLGAEQSLGANVSTLTYHVPAERWNRAAAGPDGKVVLGLDLPDAAVAASMDPTGTLQDQRLLGLGFGELRIVAAPAPPVTQN